MARSVGDIHNGESILFTGRDGTSTFRAFVLASGLRMYARCGMRPNSAWTPTAMLRAASEITGRKFKRGEYESAASALDVWLAINGTRGNDQ